MKTLNKSNYSELEVAKEYNKIILDYLPSYDGNKKQQLKQFFEDLQKGGCQSGMISEFIYHNQCKDFYTKHIDDLEEIRSEYEDNLGEAVKNKQKLPNYTFMCWFCFEEYCYDLYNTLFDN